MAKTVLAHVAGPIAQKENLATEALAFILNRSASARAALHAQVVSVVGDVDLLARVATQQVVGKESRPDLVLQREDGTTLGYVEAKFWAGLTDAQPGEYVRRLSDGGGGALVILAPERRLPSLTVEVRERLAASSWTAVGPMSFIVGNVRVGLISWSRLLGSLAAAVANDIHASSDVAQLAGLVARFEEEGFLPLTRAELDDLEVPRRMLALGNLVNDIVDAGVRAGVLSTKGVRSSNGVGHTGRYVVFGTAGAWLGLSHARWALHGRTPMWLRFGNDAWGRADPLRTVLRGWGAAEPPRAYLNDDDRCVRVPLLLPVGVEKEAVVASVVDQLRELDALMRASGMQPLVGAAPPTEE